MWWEFRNLWLDADDESDVTRLTEDDADDREPDWGTNTSTPDDDNDKNKHDSKKKHHDDNAKKKHYLLLYMRKVLANWALVLGSIILAGRLLLIW